MISLACNPTRSSSTTSKLASDIRCDRVPGRIQAPFDRDLIVREVGRYWRHRHLIAAIMLFPQWEAERVTKSLTSFLGASHGDHNTVGRSAVAER